MGHFAQCLPVTKANVSWSNNSGVASILSKREYTLDYFFAESAKLKKSYKVKKDVRGTFLLLKGFIHSQMIILNYL